MLEEAAPLEVELAPLEDVPGAPPVVALAEVAVEPDGELDEEPLELVGPTAEADACVEGPPPVGEVDP